jgi:hypothetical protein
MDLSQRKLSKSEWVNIETPVSDSEKSILQLIVDGYHNVNIRKNDTPSLFTYMKMEYTKEIELQLFKQYFEKDIDAMISKYAPDFREKGESGKKDKKEKKEKPLKTKDLIRIQSMDGKVDQQRGNIFEYILIDFCKAILESLYKKTQKYAFYLYSLIQFKKSTIPLLNQYVVDFVDAIIKNTNDKLKFRDVLRESYEFIEKNPYLLKYEDRTLFQHQKQIFTIFKTTPSSPKLVLYIAPTGTGKTLSPIGLAAGHRVIFVCMARHVGLALAKSAISVGKRVAFAFGCESAADIRLHYFAASVYTKNKRTGGIGKVDNSVGDKVEIMICDVQSYLTAMYYMLAFSPESDDDVAKDADLITYWDEPTITMDYETHENHETIHRNWKENKISKMVLSCATLPREEEIMETIQDFRSRFDGAEVHSIISHDCRKSISVLNKTGHSVLPHLLFRDYAKLIACVNHCSNNKTLLRYFDLKEIIILIDLVHKTEGILDPTYKMEDYFANNVSEITMNNLKLYYLEVLKHLSPELWPLIFDELSQKQKPKFIKNDIKKIRSVDVQRVSNTDKTFTRTQSVSFVPPTIANNTSNGILLTTEDAHTLTDGPTIFLAEDVEKVGRFYTQQTNISPKAFQEISRKIAHNGVIQQKIEALTKTLEDKAGNEIEKENKVEKDNLSPELKRLMEQISTLRSEIQIANFDPVYIANTTQHQQIWTKEDLVKNAFVPAVDEDSVRDIMALDVSDQMKLLLLLGIGMFVREDTGNLQYMEIMKRLAYRQQLFLILASSDYIYGTNYQFCHGFIGKDLTNMTQQKTIQAMGRIGRNQMQQEYTIRFRDDTIIEQLFLAPIENREAVIMSRLFSSN